MKIYKTLFFIPVLFFPIAVEANSYLKSKLFIHQDIEKEENEFKENNNKVDFFELAKEKSDIPVKASNWNARNHEEISNKKYGEEMHLMRIENNNKRSEGVGFSIPWE